MNKIKLESKTFPKKLLENIFTNAAAKFKKAKAETNISVPSKEPGTKREKVSSKTSNCGNKDLENYPPPESILKSVMPLPGNSPLTSVAASSAPLLIDCNGNEPEPAKFKEQLDEEDVVSKSQKEDCISESSPLNVASCSSNTPSSSSGKSRPPSPVISEDSDDLPEGEYEVETIVDYSDGLYFIKWKGYENSENTWEPIENLVDCSAELWRFYTQRKGEKETAEAEALKNITEAEGKEPPRKKKKIQIAVPPDPRPLVVRATEFLDKYRPATEEELEKLVKTPVSKKLKWSEEKVNRYLEVNYKKPLSTDQMEELRTQVLYIKAESAVSELQKTLKKWCKRINAVTNGMPTIEVENSADLAGPPDFTYINDYMPAPGIVIPNDPPVGCECESNCEKNEQCCPMQSEHNFAYTTEKRLKNPKGSPVIYECNSKCLCNSDCANKVVKDGITSLSGMHFCIFRTSNGCGWGLKTKNKIKKGTFVCLYVGEIIGTEEAERRGKEYDSEGSTYLFDLDFDGQDNMYTVDAAKFGNLSHFINHSCEPNLRVFGVWNECLDPNLPKLALFAMKDIAKETELTFDYTCNKQDNENDPEDEKKEVPLIKTRKCKCGSKKCRGDLF